MQFEHKFYIRRNKNKFSLNTGKIQTIAPFRNSLIAFEKKVWKKIQIQIIKTCEKYKSKIKKVMQRIKE